MRSIFTDLANETLPEIPVEDTDINEDETDDHDWMRLFNKSITEVSMTALLEDESMDFDEDLERVDYGFHGVVDDV